METGYSRYEHMLASFGREYLVPAINASKRGERLERPEDSAFTAVYYGFTEIVNTFEALNLSELLLSLAPPRSRRIVKDEYLKYLVSAYLQDVYILKERLNSYATKVSRLYVRDKEAKAIMASLVPSFTTIAASFDGISSTRGAHVHAQRYSDKELDMLAQISLVNRLSKKSEFDLHEGYKLVRAKWHSTVKSNNLITRQILDHYCDSLFEVVTKYGKLVLPSIQQPKHARPASHPRRV